MLPVVVREAGLGARDGALKRLQLGLSRGVYGASRVRVLPALLRRRREARRPATQHANPSQQARPATAAGIEAETVWSDGAHGQAYRAISQLRKTLPVSALKIPPCPNATIRRS